MPTGPLDSLVPRLCQALLGGEAGLTDGQLLEDFVGRGEAAALEAFVRRHAPMVWGVCRRTLDNLHDAEDAFQAAFLVLVRKAASIRSRELVANWLYGVAHRTACKARARGAKRRAREKQVSDMPEPAAAEHHLEDELPPWLDQELSRLPDPYRVVIVLCELEGRTRREVARQLGLPEGTVGSRLARAKSMLAKRLARRGPALPGGLVGAELFRQAVTACVPPSLESATIKAATLVAAGTATNACVIPTDVAALTNEVLTAMFVNKLKRLATVLLMLGLVSFASILLAQGQPKAEKVPEGEPPAQLVKGGYAKMRVDVEIRGTLRHADKGTSVVALWRTYQRSDPNKEVPEASAERVWKLDLSRAKDLPQKAKEFDGREVIVTGLSELRQLVEEFRHGSGRGYSGPNPQPFPSPHWTVHDTVVVTGLELAGGK